MSDACRKRNKMTENAPKSKQKWKSVDLFSLHDFNYPITILLYRDIVGLHLNKIQLNKCLICLAWYYIVYLL